MNAFSAGSIPIYWGSSNVSELFNADAFINVSAFDSPLDCVKHVLELDEEKIHKVHSAVEYFCK